MGIFTARNRLTVLIIISCLWSGLAHAAAIRALNDGSSIGYCKQIDYIGSGMAIVGQNCSYTPPGGGAAPDSATYITQTPDATLSAEQAMSALASGIVYNTTGTGVQSIATAGTDYVIPAGNVATATALAANPADCGANVFADTIAANGDLTCRAIVDADVPDTITVDLAATATALAANPTDCGAGEYATAIAASGNLTCGALTTESTTAGRSLTLSTYDVAADAELYTDESGVYIEAPAVEAMNDMFSFMNAVTVTRIWCWTDAGTVTLNVENASDANILSADLVCDVGGQSSCASGCDVNTIQGANDNLAAYANADLDISAVSTAVRVSLFVGYTKDD